MWIHCFLVHFTVLLRDDLININVKFVWLNKLHISNNLLKIIESSKWTPRLQRQGTRPWAVSQSTTLRTSRNCTNYWALRQGTKKRSLRQSTSQGIMEAILKFIWYVSSEGIIDDGIKTLNTNGRVRGLKLPNSNMHNARTRIVVSEIKFTGIVWYKFTYFTCTFQINYTLIHVYLGFTTWLYWHTWHPAISMMTITDFKQLPNLASSEKVSRLEYHRIAHHYFFRSNRRRKYRYSAHYVKINIASLQSST